MLLAGQRHCSLTLMVLGKVESSIFFPKASRQQSEGQIGSQRQEWNQALGSEAAGDRLPSAQGRPLCGNGTVINWISMALGMVDGPR